VKDLRLLGRDLSKVVLVDNAAYSYAFQVSNGVPIVPYYEGEGDCELKGLK
jgi:CTD small phosphatase-like protein 2